MNSESFNRFILESVKNHKLDGELAFELIKKYGNSISESEAADKRIAIIGAAGRFPGADTAQEYWNNITNDVIGVKEFPFKRKAYAEELAGKDGIPDRYDNCAYLDEISTFDYNYFGIPPKEAYHMEPAQRLLLEVAVEAAEDAGIGCEGMRGTDTGVYVGRDHTSGREAYGLQSDGGLLSLTGTYTGILASRISYALNLTGPALVIDTACSSSLSALHIGCSAIRNKECEMAVIAGVNIFPIGLAEGAMGEVRSREGITKPFDNGADGSIWGEAVGAVLIKSYDKAVRDRDNILGVILASAMNSDGTSNGITAPNAKAQEQVIAQTWELAGINPECISYIETHGTGTIIGDPIEIQGLNQAFLKYTKKKQFCGISSVKGNIGHTVGASGIVSLIKLLKALEHKTIPGNPCFTFPNRYIRFHDSAVYINQKPILWISEGGPRICAISSFGFSGTNCHAVVQEAPEEAVRAQEGKKQDGKNIHIFLLSAKRKEQLADLVLKYIKFLQEHKNASIEDICYTAAVGRGHYEHRLAVMTKSIEHLSEQLKQVKLIAGDSGNQTIFYNEFHIISRKRIEKKQTEKYEEELRLLNERAAAGLEDILHKTPQEDYDIEYLKRLCMNYTSGAKINWERIYDNQSVRRISLPVYPFYKSSCRRSGYIDNFYDMAWEECPLPEEQKSIGETILLFLNGTEKDNRFLKALKEQNRKIITVYTGSGFLPTAENEYTVGNDRESYIRLFQINEISQVSTIYHTLLLSENEGISAEEGIKRGCESVLYLAHGLHINRVRQRVEIIFIAGGSNNNRSDPWPDPYSFALFGGAKVLDTEFSNINCRAVYMAYGSVREDLLNELKSSKRSGEWIVSYYKHKRFVQVLKQHSFKKEEKQEIRVQDGKVYLITGGMSGIGLEICKSLTQEADVTLIIIGRTELPSHWKQLAENNSDDRIMNFISAVWEMEIRGSNIYYYQADVGSKEDMEGVYKQIKSRFQAIDGVIHCAGIFDEGLLMNKDSCYFEQVLGPKISGTLILDELTSSEHLDFFVLFSSIASMIGLAGQGAYTSANAFIDAYGRFRTSQGKPTIIINWGTWREVGGAVSLRTNIDGVFKALSNAEGIGLFQNILRKKSGSYIAADINFENKELRKYKELPFYISKEIENKIATYTGRRDLKNTLPSEEEHSVILSGRPDDAYTLYERETANVWGNYMGFKKLDIYDNYYELGGDSRIAIRIANRMSQFLNVNVIVADIFKYPVIEQFASYLEKLVRIKKLNDSEIKKQENKEYYSLSSAQERVFILDKIEKLDTSYNIPMALKLEGTVDKERIEKTFCWIISRHEVLRTSFQMQKGKAVSYLIPDPDFHIEYEEVGREYGAGALFQKFIRPFDLEQWPLMRVKLVRIKEEGDYLFFDMHHIISDETSVHILIREFCELYENKTLPKLGIQYKDYTYWQNELLLSAAVRNEESFWLNQFREEIPILDLPLTYKRNIRQEYTGERYVLPVEKSLRNRLKSFTAKADTTLFMYLLSAYHVLLMKYSGQQKIIIGSPVEGRRHVEIEDLIGMFTNMAAIMNESKDEQSFLEFLHSVKVNLLGIYENMDYQYEKLVEQLKIPAKMNRNPLFDTVFILRTSDMPVMQMKDITFLPCRFEVGASKYDLTLEAVIDNDSMNLVFEYKSGLFSRKYMERMAKHYLNILEQTVNEPAILLKNIELTDREEKDLLLNTFNNTEQPYCQGDTLCSVFRRNAELYSDYPALKDNNRQLTYGQFDEMTERLGRILTDKGLRTNDIAAVMLGRSLEEYIAIFAIIKAGGAYLPIDPEYPVARKEFMLHDSNAKILLTDTEHMSMEGFSGSIIDVTDADIFKRKDSAKKRSMENILPNQLAYMIYTSGSTGNPKGTMIEHASIVNRIYWVMRKFGLSKEHVIMHKTQYTFDVSVIELFAWYFAGASVCILGQGLEKDPGAILTEIERNNVTTIHFVPSMFRVFLDYMKLKGKNEKAGSLKIIFSSGEALKTTHVKTFHEQLGRPYQIGLYNLYGPTEAAVDVTCFDCTDDDPQVIPIGKPIDNTKVLILDKNRMLCPVGIPGEIAISGIQVGRGYLNREQLTKEKFVSNPYFSEGEPEAYRRMYLTGDTGKWMEDGNIEFIGRMDNQVKIRGFRIELSEIEEVIKEYPNSSMEAVLCVVSNASKNFDNIYAYYISDTVVSEGRLRSYLKTKLPDYMIPDALIQIDEIPVGAHGKIDMGSLPQPVDTGGNSVKESETMSSTELCLLEIWKEVLEKEWIGREDNFLNIGGNSIRLVEMYNKVIEIYNVPLEIPDLFTLPTIGELGAFIDSKLSKIEEITGGVEFPAEYISEETEESEDRCEYSLCMGTKDTKQLLELAEKNKLQLTEIIAGMYLYLLSEITPKEVIGADVLLKDGDRIQRLEVDLAETEEAEELFRLVQKQLEMPGTENIFQKQKGAQHGNRSNYIHSLILYKHREHSIQAEKLYDICMELELEGDIRIDFRFNPKRLKRKKMEELSSLFHSLLKAVAEGGEG